MFEISKNTSSGFKISKILPPALLSVLKKSHSCIFNLKINKTCRLFKVSKISLSTLNIGKNVGFVLIQIRKKLPSTFQGRTKLLINI